MQASFPTPEPRELNCSPIYTSTAPCLTKQAVTHAACTDCGSQTNYPHMYSMDSHRGPWRSTRSGVCELHTQKQTPGPWVDPVCAGGGREKRVAPGGVNTSLFVFPRHGQSAGLPPQPRLSLSLALSLCRPYGENMSLLGLRRHYSSQYNRQRRHFRDCETIFSTLSSLDTVS